MKNQQATRYNRLQQRLVEQKCESILTSLELHSGQAFSEFNELLKSESKIEILEEQYSGWQEFKTTLNFSPLILCVVYFLDLFFSKDIMQGYLLPQSYSEEFRDVLCFVVPGLFVIADLVFGLTRYKIRVEVEKGLEKSFYLTLINIFSIGFCLVIPLLMVATILQYHEVGEDTSGMIFGRIVMMILSIVIHGYTIFNFPKQSFDSIIGGIRTSFLNRKAHKHERKMRENLDKINEKFIIYRSKSEKYASIIPLQSANLTMKTKFVINKVAMEEIFWIDESTYLINFQKHPIWDRLYPKPTYIPTFEGSQEHWDNYLP